ncbi:Manganese/iron superoxide dismutase 3 [Zostera marina]|uniref:superoxide dismutase n=1 Tax=Zostera marina TaxID=29655 RepID=A0A0K9PSY0_ZOSMR|nr:Manganese/iron superoxide dismutase 3 [Zostera marina]
MSFQHLQISPAVVSYRRVDSPKSPTCRPKYPQVNTVNLHRSWKSTKVVAYYGLTSPPFQLDALEPYMSQKTLEIHWGKQHQSYVDGLNKQIANSPLYGYTLEELVKVSYNNGNPFPEFNNAAQLWNHDFFWESLQPNGVKMPWGGFLEQIEKDFGSFSNFKENFVAEAMSLFGSGWVWLFLKKTDKKLVVAKTSNAINPLVWGDIPILSLDMWEHAYYQDYKDDKEKYVNTFINNLVSWHSATARMARAEAFVNLGEPKIPVA